MRVLISGTNGFIGKNLVAELQSQDATIYPIVRRPPQKNEAFVNLEDRVLDDSQLPGSGLSDIDVVIHLAGEPITPMRWSAKKKEAIRGSRVNTTDVLSRAVARATTPPATFICGSAIGYYGSRADEELTEASSNGSGFLAEVCSAWEFATEPARNAGVRVVNARTSIVLGRNGGLLRAQLPLFNLGLGGRLGSGDQWMSWISLEDEVNALIYLATKNAISGPCNLASPNPITNTTFTETLSSVLHKPAKLTVPEAALRLLSGPQVAGEMLLTSQRVIPRQLTDNGFAFANPFLDDTLRSITQRSPDETSEPSPTK